MKYYDLSKRWKRIKKHLGDKQLNEILIHNFNLYTYGLWKIEFKEGKVPADYETCLWDLGRIGRPPEYLKYVKHGACHWLVNFNLKLACLVEPDKQWRIVTSNSHSTVWDGEDTLFDINYFALKVDPNFAFEEANKQALQPREWLKLGYACRK